MSARKGDISLVICQNNSDKRLDIENVGENRAGIEGLTGFSANEIIGKSLFDLVPANIQETFEDYIEFENDGNDLGDVVRKIRDFRFKKTTGEEVSLNTRIQSGVSFDGVDRFILIVSPKKGTSELYKKLKDLQEEQEVDEVSGIANSNSFGQKLEAVCEFVRRENLDASFAIISIDKYDGIVDLYGEGTGNGLIHEVTSRCRQTFRDLDILGYLGDGIFAVILVGADAGTASIPLNRLRWQLSNQPLFIPLNNNIKGSLSTSFTSISDEDDAIGLISKCRGVLKNDSEENKLIEIE